MRARRWMWGPVIVGLLALVTWALVRGDSSDGTPAPVRMARASGTALAPHANTVPQRPGAGLRIRGTVVDKQGAPVAGVRVSASSPEPGQTLSELPCPGGEWKPDEDPGDPSPHGRALLLCIRAARNLIIELVGAREGEVSIHAETTTGADGAFVLEGLPEGVMALWALGEQGAGRRDGVPAGTEGVEVVLEEGLTVRGTVTGEDAPLAGVSVTVLDISHSRFFDATTGPQGGFHLGPMPGGGLYHVFLTKEGWLPRLIPLQFMEEEVRLYRPSRLSGRVLSDGAPVPGVEVRLLDGLNVSGDDARVITTDAEGRFTRMLDSGTYTLSASHEGRHVLAKEVVVGRTSPEVELELELGSALHVEGTVSDEAGHPVTGASVDVSQLGPPRLILRTTTDAKGHYHVGPVEPGTWVFSVKAPGYLGPRHGERHTLGPDPGPVDFTLTRAASVTGRVTDGEGRPLPGIPLTLARAGETQGTTSTDAEGRFVLDAEEPGDSVIEVTDAPFLDASFPVRVPSRDVHLTLQPGASVEGSVADANGLRLAGFVVELHDPKEKGAPRPQRGVRTDTKGHFLLQGVAPGRYVLVASQHVLGATRRAWREVELSAGTRTQVELRLAPERTLSGIVVDGAGQPVEGVYLRARPPERNTPIWKLERRHGYHGEPRGLPTGPDGTFLLRNLTEAVYDVSALTTAYTLNPALSTGGTEGDFGALRVTADTAQVRMVMMREAHIIGRLVGPDGAPIPRFHVNSQPMEDAGGAFAVPREAQGSMPLVFEAPDLARRVLELKPHPGEGDLDLGVVRMDRGRRLQGQVVDAETGEPLPGATVRLATRATDEEGNAFSEAFLHTKDDGTFEVPHLDLEAVTLTVTREGYLEQRLARVPEHETLTLHMDPGARVEVTVKDARGRPRAATVEFHGEDGTQKAAQAHEGQLVQRGLRSGRYTVRLVSEDPLDRGFVPQRVEVPASGQVRVSFQAREGGATVKLHVPGDTAPDVMLLPGSVPPPVHRVALRRLRAGSFTLRKAEDGATFLHVPTGRATIFLLHPEDATLFHGEELDIPAGGTLSRVLFPVWRPFSGTPD